jgi:hypothetical protein
MVDPLTWSVMRTTSSIARLRIAARVLPNEPIDKTETHNTNIRNPPIDSEEGDYGFG